MKRKGKIDRNYNICEVSLKDIIIMIKEFIKDRVIYIKTREVIKIANMSLHQRLSYKEISEKEAFNAIKTTFEFIEHLYSC